MGMALGGGVGGVGGVGGSAGRVVMRGQKAGHLGRRGRGEWSLGDTYGFIARFLYTTTSSESTSLSPRHTASPHRRRSYHSSRQPKQDAQIITQIHTTRQWHPPSQHNNPPRRHFHDYFVTHLPSSSLHPDSRNSTGPHHKLPRSASTPHTPGTGPQPAAPPPMIGTTRELTVVRIPLRSAKHHFGVSVSRGTRPYNEDTHQAGTLEIPAFAKRAPVSLSRTGGKIMATSADGASGDPQVFYFGVFDGHGGGECSEWLREELHGYVERTAGEFELGSSLRRGKSTAGGGGGGASERGREREAEWASETEKKGEEALKDVEVKGKEEVMKILEAEKTENTSHRPAIEGEDPVPAKSNTSKAIELQKSLVAQWKETVGGYFRRFKPEHFAPSSYTTTSSSSTTDPSTTPPTEVPPPAITIESVLMYSFLRADLDFITAQAQKPDPTTHETHSDAPLNADEVLGEPSHTPSSHKNLIGGPTRFIGGSTASIALISTPTPTPFWHPSSPSTIVTAHVGDTRILLCDTATGLAAPLTTNHHPSSPIEGSRLRRYAATFVTDSFGEERMGGLANTRAFGDMRSKRIGVSAEPEIRRVELAPAEFSFLVLVSDGVSGALTDQEIVDVVKEQRTPGDGAAEVVKLAGDCGEGDNMTVLVVRLGGWERRGEGGGGGLRTREAREWKRREGGDPRGRKM